MKYHNYAHIELNIISKTKQNIGNSANYKNLARWNGSPQGNVTAVGSNGFTSYYGLYDTSGQVYEWTDDSDIEYQELKICRGGCYADENPINISKEHRQKFHYNSMLNEGFFGFRIATLTNPYSLDNFMDVADTGNPPDKCDENLFGVVNYNYKINKYLVTNNEYCNFLNTIDALGNNSHDLYDTRMGDNPVGGITRTDCNAAGSKYVVKPFMGNAPVTFITWLKAIKYANWLHHNKSSLINDIYTGAYNLTNNPIINFNISTETVSNILSEDDRRIVTDQQFANLNNNNTTLYDVSRESTAKYFLPNEDEWYKAAYYNPISETYWKYGVSSNDDPYAVLANSQGIGSYIEGYHSNVKKFPILISKTTDSFNVLNQDLSAISVTCPSITVSGTSTASGLLHFLNYNISGLVYGERYVYDLSSSLSNWPTKITPLSGSFIAYNSIQEINAVVQLCPKNYNDISICNANIQNIPHTPNGVYFVDTLLTVTSQPHICEDKISIETNISVTDLPEMTKSEYLNIEFLDSHDNSIIVSGSLCCHPIPIIVSVSGHIPGDSYEYTLSSSTNNISFIPASGTVSFGDQVGKITAYAVGLTNNTNNIAVLTATVTNTEDVSITSTDQVVLQCIENCEKSCDNYANFKDRAIWGSCPGDDCNQTPIPRLSGLVTTIGTNGGPGPYGTYDMDGNVYEIIHVGNIKTSTLFGARGGSFKSPSVGKNTQISVVSESDEIGFRVGSYDNPYNYPDMLDVFDTGVLPSGNNPDTNSIGRVRYGYQINKYAVTNCDYAKFLNGVASTGVTLAQSNLVYSSFMSGCYGGIDRQDPSSGNHFIYSLQQCMEDKPVRFLPLNAAMRYINWLHNNQSNGWQSTISGTYILDSGTNNVISGNRALCAKYFIPSEDEWYKAAYYKGANTGDTDAGYWNYSTMASISPDPVTVTGCGDGFTAEDCLQAIPPSACGCPNIVCPSGKIVDPITCLCVDPPICVPQTGCQPSSIYLDINTNVSGYAFYLDQITDVSIPELTGTIKTTCAGGHACSLTIFRPVLEFPDGSKLQANRNISMNNVGDPGDGIQIPVPGFTPPTSGARSDCFAFDLPNSGSVSGVRLTLDCVDGGCHDGVTFIALVGERIDNNDKILIFSSCLAPGELKPIGTIDCDDEPPTYCYNINLTYSNLIP